MAKRPRKPAAADQPAPPIADPIPDVLPLPPVAEAATDYVPVVPEIVAPPAIAPAPLPPDALPVVIPAITRADRISAGKLIARKLGIAPAAAQEQAARLSDDQVRAVLALQLAAECRERLRELLAA